jgi:hypothetical protein
LKRHADDDDGEQQHRQRQRRRRASPTLHPPHGRTAHARARGRPRCVGSKLSAARKRGTACAVRRPTAQWMCVGVVCARQSARYA